MHENALKIVLGDFCAHPRNPKSHQNHTKLLSRLCDILTQRKKKLKQPTNQPTSHPLLMTPLFDFDTPKPQHRRTVVNCRNRIATVTATIRNPKGQTYYQHFIFWG